MLIKPFPHGKGSGDSAVDYLIRNDYYGRTESPPEVIRGDPELTKDIINSIDRKWKFTSGVCSWSGEDDVTLEQQEEVMDIFERVAFAGLEPDQYDILWVRHSHVNRCELHFVIPRIELSTGNAFNAFPPGWQKDFDPLRDYENIKHGWTRPDDPQRARLFTPNNSDIMESRLTRWGKNPTKKDKDKARETINMFVLERIENGLISDRADVINILREVGLEITREGKNYLSVKDPESLEAVRLKGGVYGELWQFPKSGRANEREGGAGSGADTKDSSRELAKLERELSRINEKRAGYNRERYCRRQYEIDKVITKESSIVEHFNKKEIDNSCNQGSIDFSRDNIWGMGSGFRDNSSNREEIESPLFGRDRDFESEGSFGENKKEYIRSGVQNRSQRGLSTITGEFYNAEKSNFWQRSNFNGEILNEYERIGSNSNNYAQGNREPYGRMEESPEQQNGGIYKKVRDLLRSSEKVRRIAGRVRESFNRIRADRRKLEADIIKAEARNEQNQGFEM